MCVKLNFSNFISENLPKLLGVDAIELRGRTHMLWAECPIERDLQKIRLFFLEKGCLEQKK